MRGCDVARQTRDIPGVDAFPVAHHTPERGAAGAPGRSRAVRPAQLVVAPAPLLDNFLEEA